jgi:ketosteroid isomerase-like protein
MRNHDRKRINEPILEDEDKAAVRRTWKRLRAERFERPAMQLIEMCIDAEPDSVYKMALAHLHDERTLGGRKAADPTNQFKGLTVR